MTKIDKFTEAVFKQFEEAKTIRSSSSREDTWQRISEFILPNRGDFTVKRSKGERLDRRVFDDTAVLANQTLAAAIQNGLTGPSSKWFDFRPQDLKLQDNENVRQWLASVSKIMLAVFNSPESGFNQQNHQVLMDCPAYGTACLYIEDNVDTGVIFQAIHLNEIFFMENSNGRPDFVFRKFKMSTRQAAQEFGEDNLGKNLRERLKTKPHEETEFLHVVMPKKDMERIEGNPGSSFDFPSAYISIEDKQIVDQRGYHEMPYVIFRWEKLTGEAYGRGPGWNVLRSVQMANKMREILIRVADRESNPTLLVPDDGVLSPPTTRPGGVIVGGIDPNTGRPLVQPLQNNPRVDIAQLELENIRDDIRKGFFVDRFEEKKGTPITATESVDRQNVRLRLTGPHIERIQAEYLVSVLERVFNILNRAGALPEAPPELDGVELEPIFISPIAKLQRSEELLSLTRTLQSLGPLIETNPEILDNFHPDRTTRDFADVSGFPLENMRTEAELEQLRGEKAEAAQQQQLTEGLLNAADAAATMQKSGIPIVE